MITTKDEALHKLDLITLELRQLETLIKAEKPGLAVQELDRIMNEAMVDLEDHLNDWDEELFEKDHPALNLGEEEQGNGSGNEEDVRTDR